MYRWYCCLNFLHPECPRSKYFKRSNQIWYCNPKRQQQWISGVMSTLFPKDRAASRSHIFAAPLFLSSNGSHGVLLCVCWPSAGVGRTGTFILVDRLLQHIQHESVIDLFGMILEMRDYRPNMVQTKVCEVAVLCYMYTVHQYKDRTLAVSS